MENIRMEKFIEDITLECSFEIRDIILEKEYFNFLNEDYIIKFIY